MRIIADTNIIIRMLIKPDGFVANLFYQLKKHHQLYLSSDSLTEISEHRKRLLKVSKLSEKGFDLLLAKLVSHISIIPMEIVPVPFFLKAYHYLGDVDIDDIPFIASALFIEGSLWTSDKILYNKLLVKGFKAILNNDDIAFIISK